VDWWPAGLEAETTARFEARRVPSRISQRPRGVTGTVNETPPVMNGRQPVTSLNSQVPAVAQNALRQRHGAGRGRRGNGANQGAAVVMTDQRQVVGMA